MSKYTRGKETRNNIVMCYEGISPYWFKLWAKAALLTGRQNVLRGQYFTHLACSLYHCEGVFFWAVYNNTCALYFPQINGNARVGGGKQDGCHGQVNLSTAEQRQEGEPPRWPKLKARPAVFPIGPFSSHPSVVPYCASNSHRRPKKWKEKVVEVLLEPNGSNSVLDWER